MSDPRLSTIGEKLGGAPEHLVERSAAARATAQGIALEDVLQAWSGGEALASPPPGTAPSATPIAPVEAAPTEQPAPVMTMAPEAPVAQTPSPAPVATPEVAEEEAEPVEPVSWRERVRLGSRVGALVGALLGLVTLVGVSPLVLGRLTATTAEGGAAVEVTWTVVVATGGLWVVLGAVIALAVRGAGRFVSPAYDTTGTPMGSLAIGGFTGVVVGFSLAGTAYALGESSLSGTKLWAISPLMVLMVLASFAVCGAVVGGVTQFFSQPRTLAEAQDSEVVRRRLSDALAVPLTAGLVILIFVVALGTLLVQFPSFAPLVAIMVSIGILVFAGMMASRPNLRVTRGEVLAAAAGVGVVLLVLVLIASAVSEDGGHGSSEEDGTHAISILAH